MNGLFDSDRFLELESEVRRLRNEVAELHQKLAEISVAQARAAITDAEGRMHNVLTLDELARRLAVLESSRG